jgi:hypothetical protein
MKPEERSNRKRLSIDLPIELHKEIARSCISRNCTITKWVIRALIKELKSENGYNKQ